jgi:hypothetical protein
MSTSLPHLRPGPVPATLFAPPSAEAGLLLRLFPSLVAPDHERGGPISRLGRMLVISPFTQLCFVSFDLQAFAFLVFHRRWISLWGHGLFMTTGTMFGLAALARIPVGAGGDAGTLAALLLIVWYAALAVPRGLWAWLATMAGVLASLWWLSRTGVVQAFDPLLGVVASALLVAWSHIPEAELPPRVGDPWRWRTARDWLGEPDLPWTNRLYRAVRLALFFVWGPLNEAWATPRLLPYAWLVLMMRLGYAPDLRARLRRWADEAIASGNPAVDYVGTGGGTFLAPPCGPRPPPHGEIVVG